MSVHESFQQKSMLGNKINPQLKKQILKDMQVDPLQALRVNQIVMNFLKMRFNSYLKIIFIRLYQCRHSYFEIISDIR